MSFLFPRQIFPERPAGPDEAVLNVQDVQMLAYDLLLALDAFCAKHDLRYYLCGGTLLGAVRHHGFIPWDDDVDVFMSRPDYDRMVELCSREEVAPDTEFACLENGKFLRPFARIYDLRTQVQRKTRTPASGAHVWIDILPVDGLPDDPKAIARLYKRRKWLNHQNYEAFWKRGTGNRKKVILQHWLGMPLASGLGARRWAGIIDRIGRSRPFETSRLVGCVTAGRYGAGEAMPREAYMIPAEVTFAGRAFPTMSCWNEYLTGIFGDYMTPPPEDMRHTHLQYVTMPKAQLEAVRARHAALAETGGADA